MLTCRKKIGNEDKISRLCPFYFTVLRVEKCTECGAQMYTKIVACAAWDEQREAKMALMLNTRWRNHMIVQVQGQQSVELQASTAITTLSMCLPARVQSLVKCMLYNCLLSLHFWEQNIGIDLEYFWNVKCVSNWNDRGGWWEAVHHKDTISNVAAETAHTD